MERTKKKSKKSIYQVFYGLDLYEEFSAENDEAAIKHAIKSVAEQFDSNDNEYILAKRLGVIHAPDVPTVEFEAD